MQEINGNNKMMFKAELHKIQGESEIQSMRQQNFIDDLITQMQVQPPNSFSDRGPKPLFPAPADHVLTQHLRSVEMSDKKSRQPPATSSNNPEPPHEPKGPVGRPRNDHGVPTETKIPLW